MLYLYQVTSDHSIALEVERDQILAGTEILENFLNLLLLKHEDCHSWEDAKTSDFCDNRRHDMPSPTLLDEEIPHTFKLLGGCLACLLSWRFHQVKCFVEEGGAIIIVCFLQSEVIVDTFSAFLGVERSTMFLTLVMIIWTLWICPLPLRVSIWP